MKTPFMRIWSLPKETRAPNLFAMARLQIKLAIQQSSTSSFAQSTQQMTAVPTERHDPMTTTLPTKLNNPIARVACRELKYMHRVRTHGWGARHTARM